MHVTARPLMLVPARHVQHAKTEPMKQIPRERRTFLHYAELLVPVRTAQLISKLQAVDLDGVSSRPSNSAKSHSYAVTAPP